MKLPKAFVNKKNYEKDVKRLLKKPKEKRNPFVMEELLETSNIALNTVIPNLNAGSIRYLDYYEKYAELASTIIYSKDDLEDLSKEIIANNSDFNRKLLGMYMSALVNNIIGKEDKITLYSNERLGYLGTYLAKGTLVLKGKTGFCAGYYMKGGNLKIEDSCYDFVGYKMSKGDITIECDAEGYLGCLMTGGKIMAEEDAGGSVGDLMQSGEIHVKGKIKDIAPTCRGKIYQKGRLIWPK